MGVKFGYLILGKILELCTNKFRENAMDITLKNLFYLDRILMKINSFIEKNWSLATTHNLLKQLDFNPSESTFICLNKNWRNSIRENEKDNNSSKLLFHGKISENL